MRDFKKICLIAFAFAFSLQLIGCQAPPQKKTRSAAELALLKRVRFENSPEGARAILDNSILFNSDSAVISQQSEELIDVLRPSFFKARAQIIVEGHTDSKGSLEYNTKLSLLRAEAVKATIVARQIPPSRVITKGLAFTKPVFSNAKSEQEHGQNRRAELVFVGETVESIIGEEFETKVQPKTIESTAEAAMDKASNFFKELLDTGKSKP